MVSHRFCNDGFITYNSRQDKMPVKPLNVMLLSNIHIANRQTLNHSIHK